jgi:hypothetical protein
MYMESNGIMESSKSSHKFICEYCHYKCSYNCDWLKHLNTSKHKINVESEQKGIEESSLSKKTGSYVCSCGKSYSTNSNLGKHKKKCVNIQKHDSNYNEKEIDKDNLIMMLIKENTDFKKLLMEQQSLMMKVIENGTTNHNSNNTTTTTNSHNKAFNLNLFLNETCKNAMNISEFVDSIKLQLSDFINIGEAGFVEGISNIIVKKLNALDETIRPIHCTDQKRETFYVKDENIWEKDDDEKKKIQKVIRNVSFKNENLMRVYKETYPDYNNPDSQRSDQYSKIMIEAMDCKEESREKIIRNISKATIIKNKT